MSSLFLVAFTPDRSKTGKWMPRTVSQMEKNVDGENRARKRVRLYEDTNAIGSIQKESVQNEAHNFNAFENPFMDLEDIVSLPPIPDDQVGEELLNWLVSEPRKSSTFLRNPQPSRESTPVEDFLMDQSTCDHEASNLEPVNTEMESLFQEVSAALDRERKEIGTKEDLAKGFSYADDDWLVRSGPLQTECNKLSPGAMPLASDAENEMKTLSLGGQIKQVQFAWFIEEDKISNAGDSPAAKSWIHGQVRRLSDALCKSPLAGILPRGSFYACDNSEADDENVKVGVKRGRDSLGDKCRKFRESS